VRSFTVRATVLQHNVRTLRQRLLDLISTEPEFIIALGLNEQTSSLLLERAGQNVIDYESEQMVDTMGYRPHTGKIEADGPDTIENKFDTTRIELDFKTTRIPYKTSLDAGTTFNNLLIYHTLRLWNRGFVFLNLPVVDGKADVRSVTNFAVQEKAVSMLLKSVALGVDARG